MIQPHSSCKCFCWLNISSLTLYAIDSCKQAIPETACGWHVSYSQTFWLIVKSCLHFWTLSFPLVNNNMPKTFISVVSEASLISRPQAKTWEYQNLVDLGWICNYAIAYGLLNRHLMSLCHGRSDKLLSTTHLIWKADKQVGLSLRVTIAWRIGSC